MQDVMEDDTGKSRLSSMQVSCKLSEMVREKVASEGWKVQAVNFIVGTKSMNKEAWNKSMEIVGVRSWMSMKPF